MRRAMCDAATGRKHGDLVRPKFVPTYPSMSLLRALILLPFTLLRLVLGLVVFIVLAIIVSFALSGFLAAAAIMILLGIAGGAFAVSRNS